MELSRLIVLYDEYPELDVQLETVYGVVYMSNNICRRFPWWIKLYGIGHEEIPDEFDILPKRNSVIGIPLSPTAHAYRKAVFGQRWVENLNMDIVSQFPPMDEIHIQGNDYIPDILLMKAFQSV